MLSRREASPTVPSEKRERLSGVVRSRTGCRSHETIAAIPLPGDGAQLYFDGGELCRIGLTAGRPTADGRNGPQTFEWGQPARTPRARG
jgi:hypothetical protein